MGKKRGRGAAENDAEVEAAPPEQGDVAAVPVLSFAAGGAIALALGVHLRVFDPRCALPNLCNLLLVVSQRKIAFCQSGRCEPDRLHGGWAAL